MSKKEKLQIHNSTAEFLIAYEAFEDSGPGF